MSVKPKLDSYINMLIEGDDPMLYCADHGFVDGSNHRYMFYGVVLNMPLYVVSKQHPSNGAEIRNFKVESLWIESLDNDVVVRLVGKAADCNSKESYTTSLLLWRQYAGSIRGLSESRRLELPGNMYLDWFAYFLTKTHSGDVRIDCFQNVTILTDIPYLAGKKVCRNDGFKRILVERSTNIVCFLDDEGTTVSVGIIPKWKLTASPFKTLQAKTLTVAIATAMVDEARASLMASPSRFVPLRDFVVADVFERVGNAIDNVRVEFLDLDAFFNTSLAPECEYCIQTYVGVCKCDQRNAYFEALDHIQKMYVFVFADSPLLNGGLCQSAIALAGCLKPEDVHVVAYESCGTPEDLLGDALEATVAQYEPMPTSIPLPHWTEMASRVEDHSLVCLEIRGAPVLD